MIIIVIFRMNTMMITMTTRMARPVKGELALSTEEIDVVLELQLEDVVLGDLVRGARGVHAVTKEGQACQREVIWRGFVGDINCYHCKETGGYP